MPAPGGTVTLAITCVGLTTHTLFTSTSLVPKPTLTCPATKLVFAPVIATIDEMPAGSVAGVTDRICGWAAAGYVNVSGLPLCRNIEFWPSPLNTVRVD